MLPTIITHNQMQQAVSARSLHRGLGYDRTNYAKWATANITGNSFALENHDWAVFVLSTKTLGRPSTDYALSLDFAKRLAMMARTEAGERLRDYFLNVEKVTDMKALHKEVEVLRARVAKLEDKRLPSPPKRRQAVDEQLLLAHFEHSDTEWMTPAGVYEAVQRIVSHRVSKNILGRQLTAMGFERGIRRVGYEVVRFYKIKAK